jgi:hypothetical protein
MKTKHFSILLGLLLVVVILVLTQITTDWNALLLRTSRTYTKTTTTDTNTTQTQNNVQTTPDSKPESLKTATDQLEFVNSSVVFEAHNINTTNWQGDENDSPAIGTMMSVSDKLFTVDYMGSTGLAVNGLNQAVATVHDYLTSQSFTSTTQTGTGLFGNDVNDSDKCATKPTDTMASYCISSRYDSGTSRTNDLKYAGENEVYIKTNYPYATHASLLYFGFDVQNEYELLAEFIQTGWKPGISDLSTQEGDVRTVCWRGGCVPDPRDVLQGGTKLPTQTPSEQETRLEHTIIPRDGGGYAIFTPKYNYVLFSTNDGIRYGVAKNLINRNSANGNDDFRAYLVDLSDIAHPEVVDEITSAKYPVLHDMLNESTYNSDSSGNNYSTAMFADTNGQKLLLTREGTTYKIYDYSDLANVVLLDSFEGSDANAGLLRFNENIYKTGDDIYLYVSGGLRNVNCGIEPTLSGDGKYAYGMLLKHTIGSAGWEKILDFPGREAKILDGTLWGVKHYDIPGSQASDYYQSGALRNDALGKLVAINIITKEVILDTSLYDHGFKVNFDFSVKKAGDTYYVYQATNSEGHESSVLSGADVMISAYEIR